jgi:hypothetical protein
MGFVRLKRKTDHSNQGNLMDDIFKRAVASPHLLMKAEDKRFQPLVR